MKNGLIALALVTMFLAPALAGAFTPKWHRDRFTLDVSTPPAVLVLVRSDGKRLGVDLSKPISSVGFGTELNEFPLAEVEQQNISDDSTEEEAPAPSTEWFLSVMDESPANYTAEVHGLADAVAEITLVLTYEPLLDDPTTYPIRHVQLLVTKGALRKLTVVSSDRNALTIGVERVVRPGDLDQSLTIACRLGLITPDGICQSLEAKANAAAADMKRGNVKAAKGVWQALLNELKVQDGQHVKEPAATILREETEVLLNQAGSSNTSARRKLTR